MLKVIEYDGKIAVALEWEQMVNEPEQCRTMYVSHISAKSRENLIGYSVQLDPDTMVGEIPNHPVRGRVIFQVGEWQEITLTRKTRKPRDTRVYKWIWHPDPDNPRFIRVKKGKAKE